MWCPENRTLICAYDYEIADIILPINTITNMVIDRIAVRIITSPFVPKFFGTDR